MSNFTLRTILGILRILISVLERASHLVVAIVDVADDGVVNGSARPEWYSSLVYVCETIDSILAHLNGVSAVVSDESSNNVES